MATRKFRFTKFGIAEDPRGYHVAWNVGERHYLAEVVGVEYNSVRGCTILHTQHMNGEAAPDVGARIVDVLVREVEAG
jgi:hypothetical protein